MGSASQAMLAGMDSRVVGRVWGPFSEDTVVSAMVPAAWSTVFPPGPECPWEQVWWVTVWLSHHHLPK